LGWLFLACALWAAGCNDDEDDPSGGGGAVPSGGTDSSSSPNTSGDSRPLCERFCEAVGDCFEDCAAVCESYRAPPCAAEGTAVVECLIESYDASICTNAPGCDIQPVLACRQASSTACEAEEVCTGSATACACTRECADGTQQTVCQMIGGYASCSCYLNASKFATISLPADFVSGCSLTVGPCAHHFGSP
jgi:hypothetical protein